MTEQSSEFNSKVGKKFFAIFCATSLLPLMGILLFVFWYTEDYLIEESKASIQKEAKLFNVLVLEKLHSAKESAQLNIENPGSTYARKFSARHEWYQDPESVDQSSDPNKEWVTNSPDGNALIRLYDTARNLGYDFVISKAYLWTDIAALSPKYAYCIGTYDGLKVFCPDEFDLTQAVLEQENFTSQWIESGERGVQLVYVRPFAPADIFEADPWRVYVAIDEASVTAPAQYFEQLFVLTLFLNLFIIVLMSRRLIKKVLAPLRALTIASKQIGELGHTHRVETNDTHDEFDDLVRSFNQMSSSLDAQFSNLQFQNELDTRILNHHSLLSITKASSLALMKCLNLEFAACYLKGSDQDEEQLPVAYPGASDEQIEHTVIDARDIYNALNQKVETADGRGIFDFGPLQLDALNIYFKDIQTSESGSHIACYSIQDEASLVGFILIGVPIEAQTSPKELEIIKSYQERLKLAWKHHASVRLLQRQANFDFLTGLPNRKHLVEHLRRQIDRKDAKQNGFALIYIDLDNFKQINDSLGHKVGDQLLIEVGSLLQAAVSSHDMVARQGGDEFIVVIDQSVVSDELESLPNRIFDQFAKPILLAGHHINVSLSMGLSQYPSDGDDLETLIMNADTALYKAKQNGKSRFLRYDSTMNSMALQRLELENELWQSITHDQLFFHYQPIVDFTQNKIGFEALIRWNNPHRGICNPDDFIPISEETGFILEIHKWMFDRIFEDTAKLAHALGDRLSKVAINISVPQLAIPEFRDDLKQTLAKHKLPANIIELELTESVYFDHYSESKHVLQSLKQDGFALSLDDFGTGYSSLAYIQKLPFDRLKIDKSFVSEISLDTPMPALLSTIMTMAKNMALHITAEGVETPHQMRLLRTAQECSIQGYLFSKPIPIEECVTFAATFDFDEASPI